jgi:hypothetical protein
MCSRVAIGLYNVSCMFLSLSWLVRYPFLRMMHEIAHNTIKPSDVTITTKSQEFSSFSLLLRPVNCLPTEFHGSIAHCNSPGGRADARAPARRINVHSLLEETPLLPVRQKRSTYKCGLFDSCTKCEETACYSDRIVRSKEYIEPVSALDPIGRKDVLELLAKLRGHCTVRRTMMNLSTFLPLFKCLRPCRRYSRPARTAGKRLENVVDPDLQAFIDEVRKRRPRTAN